METALTGISEAEGEPSRRNEKMTNLLLGLLNSENQNELVAIIP